MRLPIKRIQRLVRLADRYEWRALRAVMRATGPRLGFAAHRAGELASAYFQKARSLRQWARDMQDAYGAETRKRNERLHRQIAEARLARLVPQKPSRPKINIRDLF